MPRPAIDLEQHRAIILELIRGGCTTQDVAGELLGRYRLSVSVRTIKSRLNVWGHRSRRPRYDYSMLYDRVYPLFTAERMTDSEIAVQLKRDEDELDIGPRTVRRLRACYQLLRRLDSDNKEADHDLLVAQLNSEFEDGAIYGLGPDITAVSSDRIFNALREVDPAGVEGRRHGIQRVRGEFVIPGPNCVWSVDGHMKLVAWGFEVYAAIDAYSRYIVWLYVGVTARTQVSCYAQYLRAIESAGIIPRFVRADRGSETPLFAAAHHVLHKDLLPGVGLQDCFVYGSGRKNQRIEAWWNQLGRGATFKWRSYFKDLADMRLFDGAVTAHQVAMFSVYMPLLRKDLHGFVRDWNVHTIRKQRNKPHSVAGKPNVLYNQHPGAPDLSSSPRPELVRELLEDVDEFDLDEYLPPATREWCNVVLQAAGFPHPDTLNWEPHLAVEVRTHFRAYNYLRDAAVAHTNTGTMPVLALCSPPHGGIRWEPNDAIVRARGGQGLAAELDGVLLRCDPAA